MCDLAQVRADSSSHWEHFTHGSDIGVRGVGTTKEEAFEQAAITLVAVITDPSLVVAQARNRRRLRALGCMAQRVESPEFRNAGPLPHRSTARSTNQRGS